MNCANHVNITAVGTCNGCGKGLCPECVSIFTPPVCSGCALAHNNGVAKSFWTQLILMGALFVITLIAVLDKTPFLTALGYALVAAFFPSGWNFLGRYFSASGRYLSPAARWVHLLFHAMTALFLGVIIGPIYLFKAWKELRVVRATHKTYGR